MQAHVIALALLGLIFLIVLPVKECFRRHLLPFQLASRGRDDRHRGHISSDPSTCPTRYRDRVCLSGTNSNVEDALNVLQKYDAEYIERMKVTRASTGEGGSSKSGGLVEVKTPKQVEFERAQILKVVQCILFSPHYIIHISDQKQFAMYVCMYVCMCICVCK